MELFNKKALTIEQISKLIPLIAEEKYEEVLRSDEIADVTMSDNFEILEVKKEWRDGCVWINR
jgi:hypothetical protein